MRNNKVSIVLLFLLVIAVWGYFGYTLYNKVGGSTDEAVFVDAFPVNANPGEVKTDTFSIIANYRDPFLGKSVVDVKPKTGIVKPVVVKEKKIMPWPTIVYYGLLKKNNTDKQLLVLQVNGRQYTLKNGESTLEGVSVLKVYKDSIELSFEKEKRIIKK